MTASIKPTNETSSLLGFTPKDLVSVSELVPEDIDEVVSMAGGAAAQWSRYTEMVTGGGHPQLVHAFVFELRDRGWPVNELQRLDALIGQSAGLAYPLT